MTKDEIKTRVYGVPVNLSGRIYPSFNKNIHVIGDDRLPTHGVCIWHILDPHDRKPWAMQWWAVDRTNTAYLAYEYPFGRISTRLRLKTKHMMITLRSLKTLS